MNLTLLTELQVADYLRLNPRTLQSWRQRGTGPAFLQVGRSIRYRVDEIEEWLNERTAYSTSGPNRGNSPDQYLEKRGYEDEQ